MNYPDLFDQLIDEPMPPAMDVEALIVRERRRQLRLRLAGSTAVAGVALAGLGALLVATGVVTPTSVRPTNPPLVAKPAWSASPDVRPRYTVPSDQNAFDRAISARLSPVVQKAVVAVIPTGAIDGSRAEPGLQVVPATPSPDATGPTPYVAGADVTTEEGTGHLIIEIGLDLARWGEVQGNPRRGATMAEVGPGLVHYGSCDEVTAAGDEGRPGPSADADRPARGGFVISGCAESTGQHGEQILSYQISDRDTLTYRVQVVKVDGTVVRVTCGNWPMNQRPAAPRTTSARPPLTVEQLVRIATVPTLTFWP
ncbi:MAG TPA: hypothetical protein VF163_07985 [Micromonosporaceae bacterium]